MESTIGIIFYRGFKYIYIEIMKEEMESIIRIVLYRVI